MKQLPELLKPARRALASAGVTDLEQLAQMTELEVGRLRGIGTGTRAQLREALAANGMSFADAKKQKVE